MEHLCISCPRKCAVDRDSTLGYCQSGNESIVASICVHKGEEPPISGNNGILNIFFAHCNLQCVYCQNNQISDNTVEFAGKVFSTNDLVSRISKYLTQGGQAIGFVSPSHFVMNVIEIVTQLHKKGLKPIVVYNSNAYDTVDSIRLLEPFVDIYLPDYKYADQTLAGSLSGAANYPKAALKSIKEMYKQKGSQLIVNDDGYAIGGLIIRHLVLPGYIQNSKDVLRSIAEDISCNIHVSLMAQYNPAFYSGSDPNLLRTITNAEYEDLCDYFDHIGLHKGWIQSLESTDHYNPDFMQSHPFEY